MTRLLPAAALASGVLVAARARADPLPLSVDYQAAAGCPAEGGFLDEIRWRTPLARLAAPGEQAQPLRVRIARSGEVVRGELVLGSGRDRLAREIRGEVCDEVVSALALVTALAIDPRASTARRQPRAVPAPSTAAPVLEASPSPSEAPAPTPVETLPPPEIVSEPLPALLPVPDSVPPAPEALSAAGIQATSALAVTPSPLFGGGIFVDRAFAGRWGASLRVAVEIAGTGAVDAGPGRAWFLRGTGRISGCVFTWRPVERLSLVPCLSTEGGALHGQGIPGGMLTFVKQATVPWVGVGLLPRIAVRLGGGFLEVQGGPVVPLARPTFAFAFQSSTYVIHVLPPVTGIVSVGGAVHFP
jgi:hypothetical protein